MEIPVSKHGLTHDFDNLFQKKMLHEFRSFFDILTPSSGETVRATHIQLMRPRAAGNTV